MAEVVTNHKPSGDGGVFCRYENTSSGNTTSFYLDSPPCPPASDNDPDNNISGEFGSATSGTPVGNRFGGGKFSGGTQGQVSTGFGSNRGNAMVMGLGGSQIARARVGRTVNFNPIYNKPRYVVSANMRELRRRKAQSQRPMVKLGARRY